MAFQKNSRFSLPSVPRLDKLFARGTFAARLSRSETDFTVKLIPVLALSFIPSVFAPLQSTYTLIPRGGKCIPKASI